MISSSGIRQAKGSLFMPIDQQGDLELLANAACVAPGLNIVLHRQTSIILQDMKQDIKIWRRHALELHGYYEALNEAMIRMASLVLELPEDESLNSHRIVVKLLDELQLLGYLDITIMNGFITATETDRPDPSPLPHFEWDEGPNAIAVTPSEASSDSAALEQELVYVASLSVDEFARLSFGRTEDKENTDIEAESTIAEPSQLNWREKSLCHGAPNDACPASDMEIDETLATHFEVSSCANFHVEAETANSSTTSLHFNSSDGCCSGSSERIDALREETQIHASRQHLDQKRYGIDNPKRLRKD